MPNAGGGSNTTTATTAAGGALGSFYGPVGYGIGSAAGNLAGQLLTGKGVNFRGKYARNKLAHDKKIWSAQSQHARAQVSPDLQEKWQHLKS